MFFNLFDDDVDDKIKLYESDEYLADNERIFD